MCSAECIPFDAFSVTTAAIKSQRLLCCSTVGVCLPAASQQVLDRLARDDRQTPERSRMKTTWTQCKHKTYIRQLCVMFLYVCFFQELTQLRLGGFVPSDVALSCMLDAMVSSGKASWYEEIPGCQAMISNANVLSFKPFPNCRWRWSVLCFFFLVFCLHFSDVITFPGKVEEAVSLFEEWRIVVPPNTIIISNLIKGRIRFVITKRHSVSVCANWFKYFFL